MQRAESNKKYVLWEKNITTTYANTWSAPPCRWQNLTTKRIALQTMDVAGLVCRYEWKLIGQHRIYRQMGICKILMLPCRTVKREWLLLHGHGKGNREAGSRYVANVIESTEDDCPPRLWKEGDHDTGLSGIAGDTGLHFVESLECGPARSLDIGVHLRNFEG
jgi:hypothetical protein